MGELGKRELTTGRLVLFHVIVSNETLPLRASLLLQLNASRCHMREEEELLLCWARRGRSGALGYF